MAGMTDQHDLPAAAEMDLGFAMDLGDKRAGRVDRQQVPAAGIDRDRFRHPMGRKDDRHVGVGDFVEFLDEHGPLLPQALDHVAVVDDLVADIDRLAVHGERPFNRVDRAHHTGAEAARRAQQHLQGRFCRRGREFGLVQGFRS
jgi:hypothetical protein